MYKLLKTRKKGEIRKKKRKSNRSKKERKSIISLMMVFHFFLFISLAEEFIKAKIKSLKGKDADIVYVIENEDGEAVEEVKPS